MVDVTKLLYLQRIESDILTEISLNDPLLADYIFVLNTQEGAVGIRKEDVGLQLGLNEGRFVYSEISSQLLFEIAPRFIYDNKVIFSVNFGKSPISASDQMFELPLTELTGNFLDNPVICSLDLNQGMYVAPEGDPSIIELRFATSDMIAQELSYQTMFNLDLTSKVYSVGSEMIFELPMQIERFIYPGEGMW